MAGTPRLIGDSLMAAGLRYVACTGPTVGRDERRRMLEWATDGLWNDPHIPSITAAALDDDDTAFLMLIDRLLEIGQDFRAGGLAHDYETYRSRGNVPQSVRDLAAEWIPF